MTHDQPGDAWTAVHRRHPAGITDSQPEGGDTGAFGLIRFRGNDPGPNGRDVSPWLPQLCGPYPVSAGWAADQARLSPHHPGRGGLPSRARIDAR